MADKKKMSVADILAAARGTDGGTSAAAEKTATPKQVESAEGAPAGEIGSNASIAESPAAETPAPKPATAKGGGRPSVAEMMAMARSDAKGAGAKAEASAANPAPKPAAKPAEKPVAKPAAAKPAAAKGSAGPKDTASILAAARRTAKPGPMTKAEAAAKVKESPVAKSKPVVPPMPVKPDYAKPKPAAKTETVDEGRRMAIFGMVVGSFLALGFSALATTMGLWSLGLARFMFPNVLREPPSRFKVGFPGDFAPGQVETKFIPQYGAWIVNGEYDGTPQIFALKAVCTHLGCTPNWLEAEQKFKCPCHGSGFYKDGINFEGPAPRPLERYAIRIADDGQIEVDKSKTFQEEMGQWAESTSFVTV